jgi:hypothetical protein
MPSDRSAPAIPGRPGFPPWSHFWSVVLVGLLSVGAWGQETPVAFTGGWILPICRAAHHQRRPGGAGGKILAVGPAGTPIPSGATVRGMTGRVLMPGLVDTHSHVGAVAGGDGSSPIQPEVRVMDALDVRDPSLHRARAGGITTVNVMPGSGHLVSGQTLYLKLRDGRSVDDLLLTNRQGRVAGGLKMANGTNSRRDPPFPGTRGKSAALVREKFVAAQDYLAKIERAKGDAAKLPPRDLTLETLGEVLAGDRIVQHHTHRHDDILTVLRLQKEFGFKVVLHHVSDGWKVANEIAAAKVPCSVILIDSPGGKLEARDVDWKTGRGAREGGRRGWLSHRRSGDGFAVVPEIGGVRGAFGDVAGGSPSRCDAGGGDDVGSSGSGGFVGGGEGCGFHTVVGRSAERLQPRFGDMD